jgi:hypothetical protein
MIRLAAGPERAEGIAEMQLRQRLAELARSHRHSLARELAATIAHEINSRGPFLPTPKRWRRCYNPLHRI